MKKILWCGDAAVSSGFAKCTHEILDTIKNTWDVTVLGINYRGDPHEYNYPIYPCYSGGDLFGIKRIPELVDKIKPDIIVVQNDPWNFPSYIKAAGNVPVVGFIAVDGYNCRGKDLNGVEHAIFWTKFAEKEAIQGGYTGSTAVIPLGVDLSIYKPRDRKEVIREAKLPEKLDNYFIVGNVNRNQPRKRLDLTISYFAEWIKSKKIEDAFLYLHVAPTGDFGYDVEQLASYYNIANRIILAEPEIGKGINEKSMAATYSLFDVQMTTSQGEGWGLTTMEGMACGVPQIIPDWSALGEWAKDYAYPVPCTDILVTPNFINSIGGLTSREGMIKALDEVYHDREKREELREKGLECVYNPNYRWKAIGERFLEEIEKVTFGQRKLKVV
jgi:glycosyltransferase involved in cell wall biosynthesis